MEEYLARSASGQASRRPLVTLSRLLLKNRSHRGYDPRFIVREDQLRRIIGVNTRIPSARNQQVLRFRPVLADEAPGVLAEIRLGGALPELHLPLPGTGPNAFIIVCSTVPEDRYVDIDLGISVQSMLLQAAEIGLNGICIGAFDKERIRQKFHLESEPLLILAMYSFNESRINAVWTGFTFNWYEALFQNRRVLEALTKSLFIAVISTIASTTLGTIAAIALNRYQYKYKPVINGLLYLPILIPEIVMGLSLLVLFAQAQVPLGKTTLILAHITFCVSFVVITVNARLEGMRHELEQAAMDLYATPWKTFRYVTLPLALPGIVAGALIAFTLSIDDFIISFFVAGPNSTTLPLYIYAMVKRGISPEINALSTLLMFATITLVVIAQILQPQHTSDKNSD